MTRWFGPILLLTGILCGTCAWAQNDTGGQDTGAPTQPGPQPAFTYPDATPSLDFLSQSVENSSITLGIGAGVSYYSYGYATTGTSQNWWLFNVGPSIAIQQFRPKVSWHLSYHPGFQRYLSPPNGGGNSYNNSNSNQFSQRFSGGFLWQLARRWQLTATDGFTDTANPFESYLTSSGTPTMNNPNPVTYYPLTQYKLNSAMLSLTDELTKVDSISFVGTENYRSTSTYSLATAAPFYNLISYGGQASYSHRLSARLTLGAAYIYNSLDFGTGQQRSGIQTIEVTGDYVIRPNMTISGWVGPEHTGTKTTVPVFDPFTGQFVDITTHDSLWSTALGANFAWRGRRDSVGAGFSRQVMDGGGITATSQVNSVTGNYHRMLTPKLILLANARYYHVVSITTASRTFNNYSFGASVDYTLAKSWLATASYTYLHQNQSSAFLLGPGTYSTNGITASISYSWNHPLGR